MYKHETEDVEVICSASNFWNKFKNISWYRWFLNIITVVTVVKVLKHFEQFCIVMFGKVLAMRPMKREVLIDRRYKIVQNVVFVSFIVSFEVLVVVIDFLFFVSIQCNIFLCLEEGTGYCVVINFKCLIYPVYIWTLNIY